jgi:hypothetical protein
VNFLHDGFRLTTRILIFSSVDKVAILGTSIKHSYVSASNGGSTSVILVTKLLVSDIVNHIYVGDNRREDYD